MRKAKNNEIFSILEELYAKSSVEKPVSVLFVSEMDDDVRGEILKWSKSHKTFYGMPGYYYEKNSQGLLVKTKDYGFDCSIEGHDVVYQKHEMGYGNDINFKNNEVNTFKNLMSKKGLVVDKDLRLAIYTALTPLWNNNKPIFGEEEYDLFDEVVVLELDKDVFKESFIKRCDRRIETALNSNDEDKEEWIESEKLQKEVGLYILDHPKFSFIPIYYAEEPNSEFDNYESFVPVDFYKFISFIDRNENIMKMINRSWFNISNAARKMLREIFAGSKFDK